MITHPQGIVFVEQRLESVSTVAVFLGVLLEMMGD